MSMLPVSTTFNSNLPIMPTLGIPKAEPRHRQRYAPQQSNVFRELSRKHNYMDTIRPKWQPELSQNLIKPEVKVSKF